MELNMTQLEFHFDSSVVVLSYYLVDPNYPEVTFSFKEIEKILMKYLAK